MVSLQIKYSILIKKKISKFSLLEFYTHCSIKTITIQGYNCRHDTTTASWDGHVRAHLASIGCGYRKVKITAYIVYKSTVMLFIVLIHTV